ncbi:universal stress protein [Thermosulfurimonas marina]|uniref:Universal stress protein n=1 Tax=Thermosulfurimonas marina TaxID=2047767 RepID=A0A6H1WT24_9BACT|nr:universal stress protein [Thermosulfurimonas marina]QJA06375.1 universal stress protein [Thermosulfurimonas marina]
MPARFFPHLEKILIPLGKDGASEALLSFLICLLKGLPPDLVKTVYLVHVVSSDALKKASRRDLRLESLFAEKDFLRELYREYLRREAEPFLAEARERLQAALPHLLVKEVILSGNPPKVLSRFAYEEKCGAEIIARRARSHISELLLGSCTHALVHRPGEHSTYVVGRKFLEAESCRKPRLLVCLDDSPPSWKALEEAAGLALLWGAQEMVLFHVVDLVPVAQEERAPEGEALLGSAETFLHQAGVEVPISRRVAVGEPAEEIVKEAEEGDYDLVFMGHRGRSALEEIFLGSVSERVMHRLVSPTLVIVTRR